ncbi:helix-turn-helix transcriptional regulator [Clostridium botulinum]|nr:helix-turn-helix transcriptional regulator [Clostridium botulinum]
MSDYTFIKDRRKELKMTQKQLADKVGVTSAYIQQLEKNIKQNPSFEVFYKIVDALEMDINNIMDEDKDEWVKKITRDGKVKNIFTSNTGKKFVKALGNNHYNTLSDLISEIPTHTVDFKQQLYDYIKFNYECNFHNISEKDKLTDSELHYLYKKSIEYIDLLTEKMKNEKKIAKLNNSLNKKEGE